MSQSNNQNCNNLIAQMNANNLTRDQQKAVVLEKIKAAQKKKNSLLYRKQVLTKNIMLLEGHPNGARAGLKALLEEDITGETKYLNLEGEIRIQEQLWKSDSAEIYEELAGSWGGQKISPELEKLHTDINGELHGFDTNNPKAKGLAQKIQKVKDQIRQDLNDVYQDSYEITLTREQWLNDPEKSIKLLKEVIKDPSKADAIFKDIQEKMELGEKIQETDLPIKDQDALMKFNKETGNNPLSNLDVFIKRNADILVDTKIIGSKSNFKLLHEHAIAYDKNNPVTLEGWTGSVKQKVIEQRTSTLDAQYRVASGEVDQLTAGTQGWAKAGSRLRALSNIGALGNVIWSSIGDIGQVGFANSQMGISRSKTYGQAVMSLFSNRNEKELMNLGYGIEHLQTELQKASRFNEETLGTGVIEKTSDYVMFISGIQSWSRSMKLSAKRLQHLNIVQKIQSSIDGDLDPHLDWLNWTKDEIQKFKGLDPDDFVNWPKEQRLQVIRTTEGRTRNAVLEPGSATRVWTTGGYKKGTVAGEGVRFFTQVTSFVFESFNRNILNDITLKKGPGGKMKLAQLRAEQAAVMITLGIVGDEIKNGLYNRTPEKGSPLNPGTSEDQMKYISAKMLKYSPQSTLFEYVHKVNPWAEHKYGGKSYGMGIDNVWKITSAVGKDLKATTEPRQKARYNHTWEAVNRSWNPLNIFYTRALYNATVRDSISSILDPNWNKNKKRQERRLKKRTGQEALIRF